MKLRLPEMPMWFLWLEVFVFAAMCGWTLGGR